MSRRGGPVDMDAIVARVMERAGKTTVDSAVLLDVAEALAGVGREDLSADWGLRAWRLAVEEGRPAMASAAVTFLVSRAGAAGRRALRAL